jgi:16S rRNA C1402 (ribose-2'-O) methylase RsmI
MSGTSMYDDLDKTEDEENEYFTSDPFSKLQYEDIRKVHRDETVFIVNENDFNEYSLAKDQKELETMRNKQILTPMSEKEAIESINNQEKLHNIKIMEKQYASKLKGLQHEEKNKSVLSYFLRLVQ